VARCCQRSGGRHRGGAEQGGEGRGALERCADGEEAFNGGGVVPVVVDERGEVLQLEGDPRARRRRSNEEWSSSEGAHRRGADGGDVRTESGAEEGLRSQKTGEVDAWAMGDEGAALVHGRMRQNDARGRKIRPAGGGSILRGAVGRGRPEGWTPHGGGVGEREGEGGGPWRGVEQRGSVVSTRQWPGRVARGQYVASRQWRTAGSVRRGSTWLTGGPRRYGGLVVSGWVRRGAAR
jgi:hypothetical protein